MPLKRSVKHNTRAEMPVIGLGVLTLAEFIPLLIRSECRYLEVPGVTMNAIKHALQTGYTHIDTCRRIPE